MAFPRVIATDLDGTLLTPDGNVSERARRALADATSAGVRVVIVTARPPRGTADIADLFDCAAVVCSNGAHIRLPGSGEPPTVLAIDRATSATVTEKLRACLPDVGFAVETGADFFHDADYSPGPWVRPEWISGSLETTEELLEAAYPVAKLIARSRTQPVHLMHPEAVESVGPLAEVTHSGGANLLEISAAGVNKGSTLARLCEGWDVPAEEVVAFGDMPNDQSALTWAGAGYAMANGHPGLLSPELGLQRAPANDDDGVARVVEELLSQRSAP